LKTQHLLFAFFLFVAGFSSVQAQMITGVWKGKINKQKVEVKIIQNGDNLTGTSYYYESPTTYRRYSIKGYFDAGTNEAVWWDDELIEESAAGPRGKVPLLSRADFNCPGDGKMMLDGNASKTANENQKAGDVHLDKTTTSIFADEWDFVIENYITGANNPEIIDSIGNLSALKRPEVEKTEPFKNPLGSGMVPDEPTQKPDPPAQAIKTPPVGDKPQTIEQKFVTRKKVFTTEIPVTGDSIELRFYDNAQIDGDSISLFLNERLIFEHIRLSDKAYTIKLPVTALSSSSELIMVAENLGSIPPNTSYMVALVEDKRFEARLESSEGSSAMIRLVKK
jgi:hypothetical protein